MGVSEGVGLAVSVIVAEGVSVLVNVWVGEAGAVDEEVLVGVRVLEAEAVGVGVSVSVVGEGVGEGRAVRLGRRVSDGRSVGEEVEVWAGWRDRSCSRRTTARPVQ